VDKKLDVLLCTAIIESGLDIPSRTPSSSTGRTTSASRSSTRFRGRVGRSRERAYAYLLIPARRRITRDARSGFKCCSSSPSWGAGFQIASHDLEIAARATCSTDQSGNIASVASTCTRS